MHFCHVFLPLGVFFIYDKYMRAILYSLLILPSLIILPDLFGNPDFVASRIGIASETILVIISYEFIMFRVIRQFRFQGRTLTILYILFIITLLTSLLATIIGKVTPPNYLYSITRLNYDKLFYLSLTLGVFSIGSQSTTFFKTHDKALVFFAPFVAIAIGIVFFLLPFEKLYYFTKEDSVVEYMQFFVLFFAAVCSFLLARKLFSTSKVFWIIYLLISLTLFAIAGDEISWGQRLLGMATPQSLSDINKQNEITFHNIDAYEQYVKYGYLLIGWYGSVMSLALQNMIRWRFRMLLFPNSLLFFYFFIPFLFNGYILLGDHNLGGFAEICELILYGGIALFIANLYYHQKINKFPMTITV